jgi:hypothetical protein
LLLVIDGLLLFAAGSDVRAEKRSQIYAFSAQDKTEKKGEEECPGILPS